MVMNILNQSPLHTVNYKVPSSLNMLNMEDRARQLKPNYVPCMKHLSW